MLTVDDITNTDRAEALFASDLPTGTPAGTIELHRTIAATLLARGGAAGCAAEMAGAYGDNPSAAADRMRWALRMLGEGRAAA